MTKEQGKKAKEEAEQVEEQSPEDTPAIRSVRELESHVKIVEEAEEEKSEQEELVREVSLEERAQRASSEVFEEEAGTAGRVITPVLPATGAVQAVPVRRLVAGGEEEGEGRAVDYTAAAGADVTGGRRSGAEFSVYDTVRRQEERTQQNSYTVEQMARAVAPVLNPTSSAPNPAEERAVHAPLFRNPDLEQFEGQRSKYEYHRPEREREGEQRRKLP